MATSKKTATKTIAPTGVAGTAITNDAGATIGGYDSTGAAFGFGTSPIAPATSPVVTSDTARDGYAAIGDTINKLQTNTPSFSVDYNGTNYDSLSNLIGANRTSLEARRKADIARINTEFGQNQEALQQNQRGETGTASMGLARIGGFDSASGQAALTNLQRVHTSEQNALLATRENSIRQAQNAFEDKDFALAQLQVEEARKTEQLLYDRQKDYINLTLQLRGEQRADAASELQQAQFDYQKKRDDKSDAQTALKFSLDYGIDKPFFVVGGVGYDTSTGDKLSYEDFISRGGKPDFSNAYVITPGTLEDKAFVQQLRLNYPDAGITSADSAEEAQKKIQASRIYKKEVYIPPSGGGGGISVAKTAKQADVIQRARAALQAEAAASKDGKGNPDTYRNFISEYIQADGNANDFYGAVSLDQFIHESNRKGDLAGTSIQYQQQKIDNTGDQEAARQARMNDLINRLDTLTTAELAELQQLRAGR